MHPICTHEHMHIIKITINLKKIGILSKGDDGSVLRVLVAFTKDPGLVPSTHMAAHYHS